jgi:hypothetical protein
MNFPDRECLGYFSLVQATCKLPNQAKGVTYISQGLLVLEKQEPVILFWPSILKDKGKVFNIPQ